MSHAGKGIRNREKDNCEVLGAWCVFRKGGGGSNSFSRIQESKRVVWEMREKGGVDSEPRDHQEDSGFILSEKGRR